MRVKGWHQTLAEAPHDPCGLVSPLVVAQSRLRVEAGHPDVVAGLAVSPRISQVDDVDVVMAFAGGHVTNDRPFLGDRRSQVLGRRVMTTTSLPPMPVFANRHPDEVEARIARLQQLLLHGAGLIGREQSILEELQACRAIAFEDDHDFIAAECGAEDRLAAILEARIARFLHFLLHRRRLRRRKQPVLVSRRASPVRTMTVTTSLPPNAVSPPITPPNRNPASEASFISFCIVDVLDVARIRYQTGGAACATRVVAVDGTLAKASNRRINRRVFVMALTPC